MMRRGSILAIKVALILGSQIHKQACIKKLKMNKYISMLPLQNKLQMATKTNKNKYTEYKRTLFKEIMTCLQLSL